nr:expressed protein [Hymenolepis microstoma]
MSDISQDVENVIVSGATIGFLSSAAFSEDFYMQGLLLGKKSLNNPRCLEIVAALPCDLRSGSWTNYAPVSDSGMQLVGVYKCKKSGNAQWKFSINDYKLMSMDSIGLFFLTEARENNSVVQKLFQVRNSIAGKGGENFIRQIGFKVISIESSTNLYDVSEMQMDSAVNDLSQILCSKLKNHAIHKLNTAAEKLSNTMENLYNKSCPFVKNAMLDEMSYNPNGRSNRDTYLDSSVSGYPRSSRGPTLLDYDRSVIEVIHSPNATNRREDIPTKASDRSPEGGIDDERDMISFDPIRREDFPSNSLQLTNIFGEPSQSQFQSNQELGHENLRTNNNSSVGKERCDSRDNVYFGMDYSQARPNYQDPGLSTKPDSRGFTHLNDAGQNIHRSYGHMDQGERQDSENLSKEHSEGFDWRNRNSSSSYHRRPLDSQEVRPSYPRRDV